MSSSIGNAHQRGGPESLLAAQPRAGDEGGLGRAHAQRLRALRGTASVGAALALVVALACVLAAPARIRQSADVLATAPGLRASGTEAAGRLQELADAEARTIMQTARDADPSKEGKLAASLLKMQANNWAKREAKSLAASLASAIRKTGIAQMPTPASAQAEGAEKPSAAEDRASVPAVSDAARRSNLAASKRVPAEPSPELEVHSLAPAPGHPRATSAPVPSSVIALFKQQDAKDAAESEQRRAVAKPLDRELPSFKWPSDQKESRAVAPRAVAARRQTEAPRTGARHEEAAVMPQVSASIRWDQGARDFQWPHPVMRAARSWAATKHGEQATERSEHRTSAASQWVLPVARRYLTRQQKQLPSLIKPVHISEGFLRDPSGIKAGMGQQSKLAVKPVLVLSSSSRRSQLVPANANTAQGGETKPPPVVLVSPGQYPAAVTGPAEEPRAKVHAHSLPSLDQPAASIVAPGAVSVPPAPQQPASGGSEAAVTIVPPSSSVPVSDAPQDAVSERSASSASPEAPRVAPPGGALIVPPSNIDAVNGADTSPNSATTTSGDDETAQPDVVNRVPSVSHPEMPGQAVEPSSRGQVERAGAMCAQNPSADRGQEPRQCSVWAQPAWGHMKKLPVGSSPQVANGCIQYVCRSVRAEPQKFLDQRLGLLIENVANHCIDGFQFLVMQFQRLWKQAVVAWFHTLGQEAPAGYESELHDRKILDVEIAKGLKLDMVDPTNRVHPLSIPPGTVMDSMVYGCMYPFMNCKNQLYMARHLCQDDGYWMRGIHDFNCTGGFIATATGDATKWKYVDHFALSAFLLLGLVLLGIFARGYAISRNRQMDRRFWWMHNMTRNDDDEDKGKEIIQITL